MKIGMVGLGYVGLPLAVAFAEAGQHVVGVHAEGRVVKALGAGRSHIEDVSDEELVRIGVLPRRDTRHQGPEPGSAVSVPL